MARILIVDDSRTVQLALQAALRREGHESFAVSRYQELARAVADHRPDVVVLDLLLPDGDGLACARFIRESAVPVPSIIVHSGSDPELARLAVRELQPAAVIPKSETTAPLVAAVRAALGISDTSADRPSGTPSSPLAAAAGQIGTHPSRRAVASVASGSTRDAKPRRRPSA